MTLRRTTDDVVVRFSVELIVPAGTEMSFNEILTSVVHGAITASPLLIQLVELIYTVEPPLPPEATSTEVVRA